MGKSVVNKLVIDEVNHQFARRISYVASTALLKELLQRLHAQDGALIAQGRGPGGLLGRLRPAILKPMRQFIPHPPLRQAAPQHHGQQKLQHT